MEFLYMFTQSHNLLSIVEIITVYFLWSLLRKPIVMLMLCQCFGDRRTFFKQFHMFWI